MRISELSRATGVPVATIKFYLREGLVPEGVRTSPNQAQYDDAHVQRLRLVRALVGVGGLSIAATREVLGHIDEQRGWWPVELDREELADALVAVCDSPLGGPDGPLAGVTLRGVPLADRLREMDFELPLAGGDVRDRTADVRLGDLAPLLERHLPRAE